MVVTAGFEVGDVGEIFERGEAFPETLSAERW